MPRVLDGRLSPGQLAALRLAASGYTSKQIAEQLGATEQAIHLRLNQAARSLGASTRPHAVALALVSGLVQPYDIRQPAPIKESAVSVHLLDVPELYRRLDVRRREQGLTWRQLADRLNVSLSTFSRMRDGNRPDADALVTLLVWLDLDDGLAQVIKPKEQQ